MLTISAWNTLVPVVSVSQIMASDRRMLRAQSCAA